ncbi:MAG: redox-sensing transcriptional repressor Rex [Clostridia bacterium]
MKRVTEKQKTVSKATLLRLPEYLRYLAECQKDGEISASSTAIAEKFGYSAIQVRKDIAAVSRLEGKPGTGFSVAELIGDLKHFLGYDRVSDAVIVGAGGLGRTLMSYEGFQNYGLNIIAAFDTDDKIIGNNVDGKPIYDIKELDAFIKEKGIRIGVITVPKQFAQEVCNKLVAAGIRGIWNFAPAPLTVPTGLALKNEDMAASLALLSKQLEEVKDG